MKRLRTINRHLQLQYILPIALATVLVYWRGMSVGLVADDFSRLENAMNAPQGWFQFLAYTFRPFQLLVHVVQYNLFGISPRPYHLISLAAHTACSVLVFYLALRLTSRPTVGFVASLIFALFPRHHSSVLWSIGIIYPLMALFYMLAFMAFWQFVRSGRRSWYAVSHLCYVVALSNVEMAATLPVVLLLAESMLWPTTSSQGPPLKRLLQPQRYGKYIPMVIIAFVFRALTPIFAHIVERLPGVELIPSAYGPLRLSVSTISDLAGYVVYQLCPQIPMHSLDVNVAGTLLALGSFGLLGVLFWKGSNLERFLSIWAGIQFVPLVLFVPFGTSDRHFYLPSIGFSVILGLLLSRLYDSLGRRWALWGHAATIALTALWLASCTLLLSQRIREWKVAGEMVQDILSQVKALHPEISSDTQVYFVNLPGHYGRAHVMQPGIPSAMHILYEDFDLRVRHSREARINAALRSSQPGDWAVPGVLVLQYWNGKIEDRSAAYWRLKPVFEETYWYIW